MDNNIKITTIKDKDYPDQLKKIKNAPKIIYYQGKLPKKEFCFAVVGTRRPSLYGKQAVLEITEQLAESGLIIVSGLAPGIDTLAHKTATELNKRTIAVLGTGLDEKSIYPKENIGLAKKILMTGGCLMSEYPPGTRGTKFTFPQRNRIIAGLSLGILVVEAKEKSGALITANYAFNQKKKVFAVPGSIYSKNSSGPHYLIKKGAFLTESAQDILEKINLPSPQGVNKINNTREENKEEKIILNALKKQTLSIDKIIETTKIPTNKVLSTLAILEIKGKVKNLGQNIYAISNR